MSSNDHLSWNGTSSRGGLSRRQFLFAAGASAGVLASGPSHLWAQAAPGGDAASLRADFAKPPMSSQPWTYFWWLEGVVTKAGLTADLEEMKKQGIAGVLIFDAGTSGPNAVKGPKFMSDEWRENFKHTVREAARLGMEVGVSVCTGWDAGGSWVEREDAVKVLVWREKQVTGPRVLSEHELQRTTELKVFGGPMAKTLPQDWYRELSVTINEVHDGSAWSAEGAKTLTAAEANGERSWQIPAGTWTLMQFGYMLSGHHIALPSSDQAGWEIDPMRPSALEKHFKHTAEILIQDAGEHAGKTFQFTHIDSWEIGQPTWTQDFAAEFTKRRGYDPLPYLPLLAGKTTADAQTAARFLYDYHRVVADLTQQNYYGRLSELSHQHGLRTHSEAGGPFYEHYIDAMACLGEDDVPMGEFWSTLSRGTTRAQVVSDPFFKAAETDAYRMHFGSVRQAASTARVYGKPFCQAESFTGFDRDWTEDPYYLKADGDRAFCMGLGRVVIHHYASVPDFGNAPGNQWEHVSIHFNRYLTWWNKSHAWLLYLARCQHLLRQGDFVADIVYYSGEAIPNFVLADKKAVPGYDFESVNVEALLKHASVENGRISFGHGTTYRYLVIPGVAGDDMSLPVLRKLQQLVHDGATLIASRPKRVPGLSSFREAEAQLSTTADEMWGSAPGARTVGRGRVISGKSVAEVIVADHLLPDLEVRGAADAEPFDWIHRRRGDMDLYFIANNSETLLERDFIFNAASAQPELWDAVTGRTEPIERFRSEGGRTTIALTFAAKQSFFVVFTRGAAQPAARTVADTFPTLTPAMELDGAWQVAFDPAWGAPAAVTFDKLIDWTQHSDDGVRHYSGEAAYEKAFTFAEDTKSRCFLDLGVVKNLAQVYLNGHDLGVVWTAPWRVDVTEHLKHGENKLRIEVVNLWPNRLIKDATLPKEQRLTKTNVRTYETVLPKDVTTRDNPIDEARRKTGKPSPLLPSGLMGPVVLLREASRAHNG